MQSLIISILLIFLSIAYAQASCGPYEKPILNAHGQIRCIPREGSCEGSKDFVEDNSCDERGPCFDFRICYYRYLRTECFPDACNKCKPRIYDHLFNEVCQNEY